MLHFVSLRKYRVFSWLRRECWSGCLFWISLCEFTPRLMIGYTLRYRAFEIAIMGSQWWRNQRRPLCVRTTFGRAAVEWGGEYRTMDMDKKWVQWAVHVQPQTAGNTYEWPMCHNCVHVHKLSSDYYWCSQSASVIALSANSILTNHHLCFKRSVL